MSFLCVNETVERHSSTNPDLASLSVRFTSHLLPNWIVTWKFPNLRDLAVQDVSDFSVFRFCPNLEVVYVKSFNGQTGLEERIFDDLKLLVNLKSFSLDTNFMTHQLYLCLLKSLPKTLLELKLAFYPFFNLIELCIDDFCEFTKLEILQTTHRGYHIASLQV